MCRHVVSVADSRLPPTCAKPRRGRDNAAHNVQTRKLETHLGKLVRKSLSESTWASYDRAWGRLLDFGKDVLKRELVIPVPEQTVGLFIAQLDTDGFAHSTILAHVSAIGFFHKLHSEYDPTRSFIIQRALMGIRNKGNSDCRLPLTSGLVDSLAGALRVLNLNMYEQALFGAAFQLAFTAFLRIGEIFPGKRALGGKVLQLSDLVMDPTMVTIIFRYFKHGQKQGVQNFSFKPCSQVRTASALSTYLKCRGAQEGPLFCNPAGVPILRSQFDKVLKACLNFRGLNTERYKGHSFRIGRATECAMEGMSDAQIRNLGRWTSDAFRKYIRVLS